VLVTGETTYVSAKSGKSRTGVRWQNLLFIDDDSKCFFEINIANKRLWEKCSSLKSGTPVILTLHIVPGEKHFSLESIEPIDINECMKNAFMGGADKNTMF